MSGPEDVAWQVKTEIGKAWDVAIARNRARELARAQGFTESSAEAIATAVSEIAQNIVCHARSGEILMRPDREENRAGIIVMARDRGPGIANIAEAMQDGFSTAEGLGLGLSSAERLMDDFTLRSTVGGGTTVVMRKWAP